MPSNTWPAIGSQLAGWAFTEQQLRAAIRDRRMLNPSLDLGNPCNLNCPYCFIEDKNSVRKQRKAGELSIEETFRILDDYISSGASTINLVGAGEPTIDPIFRDVIQHIASAGLAAVVFTNGIRLARTPELARFLFSHNATIVLKYNSSDPEIQDLLVARAGYTEKRNKALRHLLDVGFASQVPTRLAFDTVAVQGNLRELPAIHRMARRQNIFPIIADYIPTGRTDGGSFVGEASLATEPIFQRLRISRLLEPLTVGQRSQLIQALRTMDKEEFALEHLGGGRAYYSGQSCTQVLGLYVDIIGRIWPCVARSKVVNGQRVNGLLGNIRSGDLPSVVWKSSTYIDRILATYDGSCIYKARPPRPRTQTTFDAGNLVTIGVRKGAIIG